MIDPTRQELLKLLEELSAACPDYRFGQMIMNLAFMAREGGDLRVGQLEDEEFLAATRKHLEDWYAHHERLSEAHAPGPLLSRME